MATHSSPDSVDGFTGTQWRHLKRGSTYEVVGVAKLQTALTEGLADEAPMVVYRNETTGKLSVRSLDEFCDGRFEKLGRAAPAYEPEPVAWRWQVYGIWHYAGGYPVSGAEALYLRPGRSEQ